MAMEWKEASTKFKIAWFSWLIGAPVISVIIWRMEIPYIEIYLIVIAVAAWTAAILYKRRKGITTGSTPGKHDDKFQEDNDERIQ
jgi:hypothetical protein